MNKLPTHEEAEARVLRGEASALDHFIANYEIAGKGDVIWRTRLLAAIKDAYKSGWNDREGDLLAGGDRVIGRMSMPGPNLSQLSKLEAADARGTPNPVSDRQALELAAECRPHSMNEERQIKALERLAREGLVLRRAASWCLTRDGLHRLEKLRKEVD